MLSFFSVFAIERGRFTATKNELVEDADIRGKLMACPSYSSSSSIYPQGNASGALTSEDFRQDCIELGIDLILESTTIFNRRWNATSLFIHKDRRHKLKLLSSVLNYPPRLTIPTNEEDA